MVTKKHSPAPDVSTANGAAYEVQCVAQMLAGFIEQADRTGEIYPAVRGSLARLEALADVIGMALGDDAKQQDEAHLQLYRKTRAMVQAEKRAEEEVTHG